MRLLPLVLIATALFAAPPAQLTPVDEAAYQKLVASHKGKVVLVDFWATWCAACRAEMPHLVKLGQQLRAKGFELITISADEPEKEAAALKYATAQGIPSPFYIRRAKDDDKFINSVDPKWSGALPALFLYDKSGRKVKAYFGETATKDLEAAIGKLL